MLEEDTFDDYWRCLDGFFFLEGRQILDAILVAVEAVGEWGVEDEEREGFFFEVSFQEGL